MIDHTGQIYAKTIERIDKLIEEYEIKIQEWCKISSSDKALMYDRFVQDLKRIKGENKPIA